MNRSNAKLYEYKGRWMSARDWAAELGVSVRFTTLTLSQGWLIEDIAEGRVSEIPRAGRQARRWTPGEVLRVQKMTSEGISERDIAITIGRSPGSVRAKLAQQGAAKMATKKTKKKGKVIVQTAAGGAAGGATGAALMGGGPTEIAVGAGVGALKASASHLVKMMGVFTDAPATRRFNVAAEAELGHRLQEEHGAEIEAAIEAIPEGERATELASVFAATSEAWRISAGKKKRRILMAVFVRALQQDALEEGDAVHIIGIIGRLDYAELRFLRWRFNAQDKLHEASQVEHVTGRQQGTAAHNAKLKFDVGTQASERIARLTAERLVALLDKVNVLTLRRTWLGNRVLEYCGSDTFRESTGLVD